MKTVNTEIDVRILKVRSCPSRSGKSQLTYHIGCTPEGDIQFRIYDNTGNGFFSKEWLSLSNINQALSGKQFTSSALFSRFQGKSINTPSFLLAALMQEGLIKPSKDNSRCYEHCDPGKFMAEIKALIQSNVSLNADDKPTKKTEAKPSKKKASSTSENSPG